MTIEDDAKNTTKFHAAVQREVRKAAKDAESAAKMKFSEKRAYTVVPEIVSSKPHTSKATDARATSVSNNSVTTAFS